MSYEEFLANTEQIEAHTRAFEDMWAAGALAFILKRPDLEAGDWDMIKEGCLEDYLTNVHLDILLENAPPHIKDGPDDPDLNTLEFLVPHIIQQYDTLS